MKITALLLLMALPLAAQYSGQGGGGLTAATFASPPAAPQTNQVFLFTDASATGVCSGSGTSFAVCVWNGSSYVAIAGTSTGLGDPGSNSVVYRNGVGTSIPATATQMSSPNSCADAGSTDAYACNLSPAIASYIVNTLYWFKANTANTGAASINFNGKGALTIKKTVGGITTDLNDNDIRAAQLVGVFYDGTNAQMATPVGNRTNAPLQSGDVTTALAFTPENAANKGAASGYASLDSGTKVPIAQIPTGSSASTVTIGNDSRLSDSRTPTAHASTHQNGGGDEVATATPGANAIPKAGAGGTLNATWLPAAASGVSGYLTAADWATFNAKQAALSNPVTGTGTNGSMVKFTGTSTVGNATSDTDFGAPPLNCAITIASNVGTWTNGAGCSSFSGTLNQSITSWGMSGQNIAGLVSGKVYQVTLTHDGTTGNYTVAWPTNMTSGPQAIFDVANCYVTFGAKYDGTNLVPGPATTSCPTLTKSGVAPADTPASGFANCQFYTATNRWTCLDSAGASHPGVDTGQAAVFGAFQYDFSASTWKIPTGAGFVASAASMFGYDSSTGKPHIWYGADKTIGNLAFLDNPLTTQGDLYVGGASGAPSRLAAGALDTVVQGGGASTVPSYVSLTNCGDSTHAVSYNTSTHAWGCQLISAAAGAAGASLFSTTASTTVTATSATTLIGVVTGSTTVPANTFTAGQFMEVVAQGYYSTPATPVSLTIDLLIGGTVRITTGAVVQIASITNGVFKLRCGITTRTAGAGGTQIANCIFEGTGATITPGESAMFTSSTWAMDTTATKVIDIQATWSTATGSPTITATNVAAWIPGAPVTSVALNGGTANTGAVNLTNVVVTNAANTYSAGAQDFTSAASMTFPVSGGAAPTANGTIAYDSTQGNLKIGGNGAITGSIPRIVYVNRSTAANNCLSSDGGSYTMAGVTNTCAQATSETNFTQTFKIPANSLVANKIYKVTIVFHKTNPSTGIATQIKLKLCTTTAPCGGTISTIFASNNAQTPGLASTTDSSGGMDFFIAGTAALGSSVLVESGCMSGWGMRGMMLDSNFCAATTTSASLNTTVDQYIYVSALYGASTAGAATMVEWVIITEMN